MDGKVLVVDDEDATRSSLADILRLEGCQVKTAANGDRAVEMVKGEVFDLILLDLKMPGMDGLEVMRQVHQLSPDTRLILLTAHGSLESAIEALRRGAHDYLLKPSSPANILRSVQAGLLRRAETQRKRQLIEQLETSLQALRGYENPPRDVAAPKEPPEAGIFRLGNGILIDTLRREVQWEGRVVLLTPAESRLLRALVEVPGRLLGHRELVQMVQGYEATDWEAPEVLRPLVSRLRRKLAEIPNGEKWIVNVRGAGYMFKLPT